jgi:hypothetical protein
MRTCVRIRELGSNSKGAVAEAAIRLAAIRCEVDVYTPVSGHSRADLVFDVGDELYRVQVKWASLAKDEATINVHTSGSRLTPSGYVRTPYGADEIELLAVDCGELDRSYLLPPSCSRTDTRSNCDSPLHATISAHALTLQPITTFLGL